VGVYVYSALPHKTPSAVFFRFISKLL
jgi:hypothetical protein